MTKFPVWATVKDAYGYVFHNYKEIVRDNLAVIGAYLGVLIGGLVVVTLLPFVLGEILPHIFFTPVYAILIIAWIALMVYAGAVLMVSFMRQAMGLPKVKQNWRPFSDHDANAFILSILLMYAIMLGGLVVTLLLGVGGAFVSKLAAAGIILVCNCAVLYAFIRAYWLIAPVVVAEHHIALKASWKLDKGNFWRIFGVSLGIYIPFFIVIELVMRALTGSFSYHFQAALPLQQNSGLSHVMPTVAAICIIGVLIGLAMAAMFARAQARCYQLSHAKAEVTP